ncbi:MAG: DNA gyrase subunit A [Myxococcales bacterium]|nr:DNA gyrase subunit A [Myxococcales bacterium]
METQSNQPTISIEEEMRRSYVDYAMSVIIGRALPDVRDGLKPVHRRVLFAMHELRNVWNSAYKKSARIVGDVIGKYHPHGDQAVYDTIVRMAQDFSMRYLLVDGQGNFGSVDGDPPAAMRYTEIRMARLAGELLADLEKETVNFGPNYDGSESEPLVLPSKFPNLLVNGSAGIAVGMATNIPPHNLRETIDASIALLGDGDLEIADLMQYITGPDFPTGAFIYGTEGIREAYHTGRGIIKIRARADIEEDEDGNAQAIVIHEIPYQLNKAKLLERIAELVREKRLEGIRNLRDESDRDGMRVVIELKRDAMAQVVLNHLYQMTPLQSSFGINMLAIVQGQPQVLNLKEMLQYFLAHRRDVVTRRCLYELRKAEERAHILEGYRIALDNLDDVIALIRASAGPQEARDGLVERFGLTLIQAQAILELRLHRLTGMERDKIMQEYNEVLQEIERLKAILASDELLRQVIVDELVAVREQYGDERRTEIVAASGDLSLEDLIAEEPVVVTISHTGYIKRTSLEEYQAQHRGGKGKTGMQTREEDFVTDLFVASTHSNILVFTDVGKAYVLKVYELPHAGRTARGTPIVNLIQAEPAEKVRTVLPIAEFEEGASLLFATRRGTVKKTDLMSYSRIRSTGIIALVIDEGDDLIAVRNVNSEEHVVLATKFGQTIRFKEDDLRQLGRVARGVRGVRLQEGDEVVGLAVLPSDCDEDGMRSLLSVTENGYGKRTLTSEYPVQNRGGLGVITIKTSKRNGFVVGIREVRDQDQFMLITDGGKILRLRVGDIQTYSRNTQGVRLISVEEGERVIGIEKLFAEDLEDENGGDGVLDAGDGSFAAIGAAGEGDGAPAGDGESPSDADERGGSVATDADDEKLD